MYHVCVLYIAALISPSLVQSCGYIPDSCYGDLNWAVSTGKTKYPQYYPNFQSVTGTTLSVASQDDMVTYWACTGDPNGNCGGLELPCSRSCYPSTNSGTTDNSGSSSSGQSLTVVTQNLFWWNLFGQRGGANFYNAFKSYGPYDILLFQECDSVTQIKNGLGYDLSTYSPCHAVAMAWSNSRFTEISKGYEDVGEDRDDQYYGTRCLVWARLQDKVSNKIVFAGSHHGPLPVNTGGKTGGYSVAQRINEVITKNLQSGDTVILGGDFNAESYFTTVTTLRDTFGYNLRKSDWVDHIFTKNGLDATPQITVIPKGSTGSDHDGLKLVWSNGLGGSDTGSGTVVNPSPAPASCGYIPTSCSSDLSWAVNSGKYSHSEYYSNFQSVTGVSLSSASQDDMVTYFVCTGQVLYTLWYIVIHRYIDSNL